ncbi:DUF2167 domain-containing protein [Litoribrevibacter albus]|uniref:DUF2167 domain-containing protein n=1 Tax=Litoribrevibacter albus TaxID=1473156 RepID=A0AA37S8I2_9GAMM|nr:DUF2167 domain-containing protein [Litoribrevibacter albus]GLQ30137.1 hypothetical protein GCM10007876_06150 [Litoribrevibacter albus]
MTLRIVLSILLGWMSFFAFAEEAEVSQEEQEYLSWAKDIWDSLDRQTGEIKLPEAGAVLNVPENFYYLGPQDAEKVLVDVWGNPPGQLSLGMLFPEGMTPFDGDSWAVTINYEEDGYVSDEDADEIDYEELLDEMKADAKATNKARKEAGYDTIEIIGWAAPPYYDSVEKKLHWAKEIQFGSDENHTLNYNIRVLGRKGVLVLNFIAGMNQKQTIDSNISTVLALASFDEGSQYSDFDPEIDKVAAYGLGALVAGKVIAKTGILAAALLFLKKFGVFILVGIGAIFKSLFSRKKSDD